MAGINLGKIFSINPDDNQDSLAEKTIRFFTPKTGTLATAGRNFFQKPVGPTLQNIGTALNSYRVGRIEEPIKQGVQDLLQPGGSKVSGLLNLAGGIYSGTPAGVATNTIETGLASIAQGARTQTDPVYRFQQNIGNSSTGVGTTGFGLKGIPGFALDLVGGGVSDPGDVSKIYKKAQGVQPIIKEFVFGTNAKTKWDPRDLGLLETASDLLTPKSWKNLDELKRNNIDDTLSRLANIYLPQKTVDKIFDGVGKPETKLRKLVTELNKVVNINNSSFSDVGAFGMGLVGKNEGSAQKVLPQINNTQDLISAIKSKFNVKSSKSLLDVESNKLDLKKVLSEIKTKYAIEPNLLKQIESGETITAPGITLQANGKRNQLLLNLSGEFNPAKITQEIKPTSPLPGINLNVSQQKLLPAPEPITQRQLRGLSRLEKNNQLPEIPNNLDVTSREGQKFVKQTGVDIRGLTTDPETAKQIYKKTGQATQVSNVIDPGKNPIRVPNEPGAEFGAEMGTFMDEARRVADTTGNKEVLGQVERREKEMRQFIQDWLIDDPVEGGKIDEAWNSVLDRTGASKALDMFSKWYRSTGLGTYIFQDKGLDDLAKKTALAKESLFSSAKVRYDDAVREIGSILGRPATQDELGAILRGDAAKEYELAKKGVTSLNIGEDVAQKADKLQEAFNDVHVEIGAYVLTYERMLDDLIKQGVMDVTQSAKYRIVDPKDFAKNLKTYVRTVYDKSAWSYDTASLYEPAVNQVGLTFSTAKKKLTDQEWGIGYLNAIKEGEGYQVTRSQAIPEDLLARVESGEDKAIAELGRRVKELRGYITEGDAVMKRTVYNLTNNIHDLNIIRMIGDREDLFSNTMVEGWHQLEKNKGWGPLEGKFVPNDVWEALKEDKNLMRNQTDEVFNTIKMYGALWRGSKTILNPGTWFNNQFMGMTVMQAMAGNSITNPANWKYYGKGYGEFWSQVPKGNVTSPQLKKFMELGGLPGTFADTEVLQIIQDATKEGDPSDWMVKILQATEDWRARKAYDKLGEMYSYLDAGNKYVTYLNKLDHGYTDIQAIKLAQKYHLNYLLSPKWVRNMKERGFDLLLPFQSFTQLFGPVLAESVVKKPWRLAGIMAIVPLWNMAQGLRNPQEYSEAQNKKPSYANGNPFALYLGTDENGHAYWWDMSRSFNLPFRTDTGEFASETTRMMLGSFSNIGGPATGIQSALSGVDVWGRNLDQPGAASIPGISGRTQNLIESTLPTPPIAINAFEAIRNAMGYSTSSSGTVKPNWTMALRIGGINVINGSPDQLEKNINAELMKLNDWKGYLNNVLADPNASQAAKKKVLQQYIEKEEESTRNVLSILQKNTDVGFQGLPFADMIVGSPAVSQVASARVKPTTSAPKFGGVKLNVKAPKRKNSQTVDLSYNKLTRESYIPTQTPQRPDLLRRVENLPGPNIRLDQLA